MKSKTKKVKEKVVRGTKKVEAIKEFQEKGQKMMTRIMTELQQEVQLKLDDMVSEVHNKVIDALASQNIVVALAALELTKYELCQHFFASHIAIPKPQVSKSTAAIA